MAKWGEPPHPNTMAAIMSPEARRLSVDIDAAKKRIRKILIYHQSGATYKEIASKYKVSPNRIGQIVRQQLKKQQKK